MRNLSPVGLVAALWLGMLFPAAGQAQSGGGTLRPADSLLVGEVLLAEERRDAGAPSLRLAAAHADPRVRRLAARALARITDSTFAARDALGQPGAPPFPVWPEPEWKAQYRALTPASVGCEPLVAAAGRFGVPALQLRAMDLAGARPVCATDPAMLAILLNAVNVLPPADGRDPHPKPTLPAAHALVALSRLAPDSARPWLARLGTHRAPEVRRAVARAALQLRDSVALRALARDTNGNVLEAVLSGLSRVTGRSDDSLALRLLTSEVPQVALAAAEALKGSTHPELASSAAAALDRYVARARDSEREVRLALLALLGRPLVDPHPVRAPAPLPRDAVALALGEIRYLQVEMFMAGRFVVELRGDIAPIMAARILEHARAGGYDGQAWHRVEWDFVIQGGSPHDNEYSGAARYLVDELGAVPHPRGSVGMSTRGHDTGDAQWFINLRDNPRLMRDYTVFAVVVSGMDVVDRVLAGDVITAIREVSAPSRRGPP
jgi:cyclophilin family peptidyl-prolyl cis-trans isomerase